VKKDAQKVPGTGTVLKRNCVQKKSSSGKKKGPVLFEKRKELAQKWDSCKGTGKTNKRLEKGGKTTLGQITQIMKRP